MYFFLNSKKMFFFFILMFSTFISISANSWLGCWIGLEINLLSFIPLINNSFNLISNEASLKYFIVQSIASINFLFFILINMFFLKNNLISILMNLPLLMKMGSAPFHFWFPNIIEGLSWMNTLILMTWQKISPMILLSYYFKFNFLYYIMILNVIIGSLGGISQISLRKMLAFSSINNLSWMMFSLMISEYLWLIYFTIYSIMNSFLCYLFFNFNSYMINQLFFYNINFMMKNFFFMNFLSLGGLPPFLGFLPKWLVINYMIMNDHFILIFIFIMMSLIMLFFYIRITFSSFLNNYLMLKWLKMKVKNSSLKFIMFFSLISLFSLPISTLLFIY